MTLGSVKVFLNAIRSGKSEIACSNPGGGKHFFSILFFIYLNIIDCRKTFYMIQMLITIFFVT